MDSFSLLSIFLLHLLCFSTVLGKECTNIPTPQSSHTARFEMNNVLTEEVNDHSNHQNDEATWRDLFPRAILKPQEKLNWEVLYKKIKYNDLHGKNGRGEKFLKDVSLHDVRLDPDSVHGQGQQTTLEYLLMLDVDRLAYMFRNTSGLPMPGKPYGGWEAPDKELRGHFVGHYLSATAMMWASTHNDTLYKKMNALVTALSECQDKFNTGYLSAFPDELFDRVESVQYVWAPYYTIHKIMAGLLDQYTYAGNFQALRMVVWMADYFRNRVHNVITRHSIERHWLVLNEETGGMNEVLYKLYSITEDPKHLVLAHLFDKPCFLGMLALKTDQLSGFHANTHIPIIIGTQMRYEVTGDPLYKELSTYFMDIVNASHTYATGGTSCFEFWQDPKRIASYLMSESQETCSTYNMLKISRNLFRWTKEVSYADYYEKSITNGVLTVIRGTEPGVMLYMLPLAPGSNKNVSYHGWGNKFDSFWCCYGTGIESFSKLGDSIYFEEEGTEELYIVQLISSSFDWKSHGLLIKQKVEQLNSWDNNLKVTFTFSTNEASNKSSTLNLRMPYWANSTGTKAKLNGEDLSLPSQGGFLSISRNWNNDDKLTLELPVTIWTEAIKDDRLMYSSIKAIFYGPYILAGLSDGDWDLKVGKDTPTSEWITPIPSSYNSHLFSLSQEFNNKTYFWRNNDSEIKMAEIPDLGTNNATHATFRFVLKDDDEASDGNFIGKTILIETFNYPGSYLVEAGDNANIVVWDVGQLGATFKVVEGLDKKGTVSFESQSEKGCFIYSAIHHNSTRVMLKCQSTNANDADGFERGASFKLEKGFSEYHPMSFFANGVVRKFLLQPLHTVKDESYTAYFNLGD